MSIQSLRPARPVRQIYLDASSSATKLARYAEEIAEHATTEEDKATCLDHAGMAHRFAQKALKAADKTIMLLNDGTLKEYCAQFDKVFAQFVSFATVAEKELKDIAEKAD